MGGRLACGRVRDRNPRWSVSTRLLRVVVPLLTALAACSGSVDNTPGPAFAVVAERGVKCPRSVPETARCREIHIENVGDIQGSGSCEIQSRNGSDAFLLGSGEPTISLTGVPPGNRRVIRVAFVAGSDGNYHLPRIVCDPGLRQ
jgi:hypothetical protein